MLECGGVFAGESRRQQRLEAIGYAGEGGMNDDRVKAFGKSVAQDGDDVAPVIRRRHTGAAKLENDPGLAVVETCGQGVLVVFEDVAQLFFQLPLGQYVLNPTPGRLAALAGGNGLRAPFGALQHGIEFMGFFGFAKKLLVDIEMFVVAFTHFSRKALEINGIASSGLEVAHYIRFCTAFN